MAPTASPSSVAASPRTPVSHDAWERVETDFDKENDRIIWRYPKEHRLITAPARASLLDEFVHLVDAPSKAIVEFADRHGVLLLCEKHNFPSTHATAIYDDSEQQLDTLTSLMGMTAQQARRRAFRDGCELRVMDDGHRWYEPIEGWRHFSREARALLRVATAVYDKKPAPLDEWKTLMIGTTDFDADHVPSHENARWGVAHCVNAWLDLGRVGPIFEWWSSGPDVKFGRRSLFSALALQLMATIGRHGLATCDACGRPYFVRRRPPKGRRGFCEDKACKREAWRLAKRDQYDRKTRRAPVTPRRGAKR